MATISFWVAEDFELPAASGLGFYGDNGFGANVGISLFQGRTFTTSPDGTLQGFECNNNKLYGGGSWSGVGGVSGVVIGQVGNGINLLGLPNYLASMNLRFTHGSAVRTQNAVLYIHDGVSRTADPSGLLFYGAEIRHLSRLQTVTGDGDSTWKTLHGSGSTLGLVDSPGISGLRPDGALTLDTRHDWYAALSCSPVTPTDKQFGFSFELEYI